MELEEHGAHTNKDCLKSLLSVRLRVQKDHSFKGINATLKISISVFSGHCGCYCHRDEKRRQLTSSHCLQAFQLPLQKGLSRLKHGVVTQGLIRPSSKRAIKSKFRCYDIGLILPSSKKVITFKTRCCIIWGLIRPSPKKGYHV